MTRAISGPVSLRIYAPGALPSPGAAKLVSSAGAHQSARPSQITSINWTYSLFASFGVGVYNPHYSARGAYVLAGTGGHSHPATFGAVAFNFDTYQWEYLPCANGPIDRNSAVLASETNGPPWYEVSGYTEIPAPPHPYRTQLVIPPSAGGGAKGSMVYVGRGSVDSSGNLISPTCHAFDLVTRTWARRSQSTDVPSSFESTAVHDPVTNRYYAIPSEIHLLTRLKYIDGADWTLKETPNFPMAAPGTGTYSSSFLYEGGGKRLIVNVWGSKWQAIDLSDISSGWRVLATSGARSDASNGKNAFVFHAAQGVLYWRDNGPGNQLYKITPPANPLTGTWVITTVTLTGDAVPEFVDQNGSTFSSYGALMYISALEMLAFVTANGVALLNP